MPQDANKFKPVPKPAASLSAMRAAFKKATPLGVETVTVTLPEIGEIDVEIRSVPADVRWRLEEKGFDAKTDRIRASAFYPELLVHACYDPASGERIWGDDDFAEVGALDIEVIRPLARAALRVSGFTKEGAPGNGSADAAEPGSAGASASPAN